MRNNKESGINFKRIVARTIMVSPLVLLTGIACKGINAENVNLYGPGTQTPTATGTPTPDAYQKYLKDFYAGLAPAPTETKPTATPTVVAPTATPKPPESDNPIGAPTQGTIANNPRRGESYCYWQTLKTGEVVVLQKGDIFIGDGSANGTKMNDELGSTALILQAIDNGIQLIANNPGDVRRPCPGVLGDQLAQEAKRDKERDGFSRVDIKKVPGDRPQGQ